MKLNIKTIVKPGLSLFLSLFAVASLFGQGQPLGGESYEDRVKRDRTKNMTMRYLEYVRGMSSPTVSTVQVVDGNSNLYYHDMRLDDLSFYPDNSLVPNAPGWHKNQLDVYNTVAAFTEPYYGVKFHWFLHSRPQLGFGIDYTHLKVDLIDFDQAIRRTGTIDGVAVDDKIRAGDYFYLLSVSHGVNHVAFTATYRWMLMKSAKRPDGLFQPFVGIGAGPAIPHGELTVLENGERVLKIYGFKYTLVNYAFEFNAGLRLKLDHRFSFLLMTKFAYSMLQYVPFEQGDGYMALSFPTAHLQWGLSGSF